MRGREEDAVIIWIAVNQEMKIALSDRLGDGSPDPEMDDDTLPNTEEHGYESHVRRNLR